MYSEVHYHLYNSGGARITPATRRTETGQVGPIPSIERTRYM